MIFSDILSHWINALSPQFDFSKLNGKLIEFKMLDLNLSKQFLINGQRIEFSQIPDRTPDLIISGDIYTLWQFMGGNDRAAVTIEGDLKLAVELQKIIQESHIDWAEWLYQLTGDFPNQLFKSCQFNSSKDEDIAAKNFELEQRIKILEEKIQSLLDDRE